MELFNIDYSDLEKLNKKTYKLKDVEHKLVRVAFDVVRFSDGPVDELWEIQSADDGDYIVARYNDDAGPPVKEASTKSQWEAIAKEGEVHLFYKGMAFTKIAHKDADVIKNFLPTKLSSDRRFVNSLLSTFSAERKTEIKKLYPELF